MTTFLYLDTNWTVPQQFLQCSIIFLCRRISVICMCPEECVLNLQVGLFQVSVWPFIQQQKDFQVTKSERFSKKHVTYPLHQGVGCLWTVLRGRTAEGRRGVTDRFIVQLHAPGRAGLLSASLTAPTIRPVTLRQWARPSRKANLCESLGCVAIARGHGASDGETHTSDDGLPRPERYLQVHIYSECISHKHLNIPALTVCSC